MNLSIIKKNHAADPEVGFLTKSILKPYGRATAMPPPWQLTYLVCKMLVDMIEGRQDTRLNVSAYRTVLF